MFVSVLAVIVVIAHDHGPQAMTENGRQNSELYTDVYQLCT